MKLISIIAAVGLAAAFVGCSGGETTEQKITPESRGQRGETCQARNDCTSGLACISGTCSLNDFSVDVSVNHCDQVDCQATADCCGDLPTEAPAKCADRVSVCQTPSVPGCTVDTCTSDSACNGGTCGGGSCSQNFTSCDANADCEDTCDTDSGLCTLGFTACVNDDDCTYDGTCTNRFCDCTNPDYDPFAEICTDPDCEDLCSLRCEDERCVPDTSCETNADCFALGLSICNDNDRCVECEEEEDCNTDAGESCNAAGFCEAGCTQNEECPLFHQCIDGDCVETGCTSDRECILAASQGHVNVAGDARQAQCLPSDLDANIYACKIPCENDGACGAQFEVCDAGYCKFVGCETDEECRSYLGLANQTDDVFPYIPKAVCRP